MPVIVPAAEARSWGMIDQTTALFVVIDDLRLGLRWQEDARRTLRDSEVVTAAVVAARFFGGNQERACVVLRQTGLMPAMLRKSRFCRRLHQVGALIERLFWLVGLALKQTSASPRFLLDSFPVALCDNIRIKRCRLVAGNEAFRGKNASKRRFFYGVRVVVLCTEAGAPVEFAFLPGAASDVRAYNPLPLCLPAGSEVLADCAFVSEELETLARELDGMELSVCLRQDSVRRARPQIEARKQLLRQPVERVFSAVTSLLGRYVHATTFRGFQLKLLLTLFAYTLDKHVLDA